MTIKVDGYKYFMENLGKTGEEHGQVAENPYIQGPNFRKQALEWWSGFNEARILKRALDQARKAESE